MFQLLNYNQGKLILLCVIVLILSCFQGHNANSHINSINEEKKNSSHPSGPFLPRAPFAELIIILFLLVLALALPLNVSD